MINTYGLCWRDIHNEFTKRMKESNRKIGDLRTRYYNLLKRHEFKEKLNKRNSKQVIKWTEEEDNILIEVAGRIRNNKTWIDIHNEFIKRIPETNRTIYSLITRYYGYSNSLIRNREIKKTVKYYNKWTEVEIEELWKLYKLYNKDYNIIVTKLTSKNRVEIINKLNYLLRTVKE